MTFRKKPLLAPPPRSWPVAGLRGADARRANGCGGRFPGSIGKCVLMYVSATPHQSTSVCGLRTSMQAYCMIHILEPGSTDSTYLLSSVPDYPAACLPACLPCQPARSTACLPCLHAYIHTVTYKYIHLHTHTHSRIRCYVAEIQVRT